MPVYNTAQYLVQSVQSVINQTIGFEENIQIVLVNDGSSDDSDSICTAFAQQYPKNIVYLKQANAGVSAARNLGVQYCTGLFINFLDSDDYWSPDAFSKIYSFFSKHAEEVDMVSARMQYCEARTSFHPLDYKFSSTRIVNLLEQYQAVQLHCTSLFIKKAALTSYRFDTRLSYAEDAYLINTLLLHTPRYGVVREALHRYRVRETQSSALQKRKKSLSWYLDTPTYNYDRLCELSVKLHNSIVRFVQYLIMYDFQWRLTEDVTSVLAEAVLEKYLITMKRQLTYIEDLVILNQRYLSFPLKVYCLSVKYNRDIRREINVNNSALYFHNNLLMNLTSESLGLVKWHSISRHERGLLLSATDYNWLPKDSYAYFLQGHCPPSYAMMTHGTGRAVQTIFGSLRVEEHIQFKLHYRCWMTGNVFLYLRYRNETFPLCSSMKVDVTIPKMYKCKVSVRRNGANLVESFSFNCLKRTKSRIAVIPFFCLLALQAIWFNYGRSRFYSGGLSHFPS